MTVLAPYACDPAKTKGRLVAEAESSTRTCFQRDRDRIIHSTAFRRMKHKTQVFVYHEGDHYRTRLTHSLEVAQIARSLSRSLGLDEDLAEALALAHDLGHPPFGHAGEDALSECMAEFGGFDHNVQTFRLLTKLEARYASFDGLNLCWETVDGLIKHNGPVSSGLMPLYEIRVEAGQNEAFKDLSLAEFSSLEAQVAALSDDIAYNTHDIDDGLRAGAFAISELRDIPIVGHFIHSIEAEHPNLEITRLTHETTRRLISELVDDLLRETRSRLERNGIESCAQVRNHAEPLVALSDEMAALDRQLKDFLLNRVYRHYQVNRTTSQAKRIVEEIFDQFIQEPNTLPTIWFNLCDDPGTPKTARIVCDYIAGMTDRFALKEHKRLFSLEKWA